MTHIFYSPHPDDETLAMAGHITMAKDASERVVVVALTPGELSARARRLFSGQLQCPIHGGGHSANLATVLRSRHTEMAAACGRLDIDNFIWQRLDEHADDLPERVHAVARDLAERYPGAVHHFAMGSEDRAPDGTSAIAHRASCIAGQRLACDGTAVQFHWIYIYGHPREARAAMAAAVPLPPGVMAVKQEAMKCYRLWAPNMGRYAYGYHSVPELFDAAAADTHEYISLPEHT